jgi:hypothetical protein
LAVEAQRRGDLGGIALVYQMQDDARTLDVMGWDSA